MVVILERVRNRGRWVPVRVGGGGREDDDGTGARDLRQRPLQLGHTDSDSDTETETGSAVLEIASRRSCASALATYLFQSSAQQPRTPTCVFTTLYH